MRISKSYLNWTLALASLPLLSLPAMAGMAVTDMTEIGLYGSCEPLADGIQSNSVSSSNQAGHVLGVASCYNDYGMQVSSSVWQAHNGTTTRLGLTDDAHTRYDGVQHSEAGLFEVQRDLNPQNQAGQVVGWSQRYSDNGLPNGHSIWQATDGVTHQIGLTDAEHTFAPNGAQNNDLVDHNQAGQVVGNAERYWTVGGGQSTWFADGGITTKIGLYDSEHRSETNKVYSFASDLNSAGQVIGASDRYKGVEPSYNTKNRSAWRYQNGVTTRLGYTDASHTGANGRQYSKAYLQNEAGQIAGESYRYGADGEKNGMSAWITNGDVTTRIGLLGDTYTGNDGAQHSNIHLQNEANQAVGFSVRYDDDGNKNGSTTWLYSSGTYTQIGLYDNEHGSSISRSMNELGQVAGESIRLAPDRSFSGYSTWVSDADGSTYRIGLTGSEYTKANGHQENRIDGDMTAAGQILGYTERYGDSGYSRGRSAWIADKYGTTRLGMTDATHTSTNGTQFSLASRIHGVGLATGYSTRYDADGKNNGMTAWFYHQESNRLFDFNLSESSSGYSYSYFSHVTTDGFGMGRYRLYDGDRYVGMRPFGFTVEKGFFDLNDLLQTSLAGTNWESVSSIGYPNSQGLTVGGGITKNGKWRAFQAKLQFQDMHNAPEPPIQALLALGLLGLIFARHNRQRRG